MLKLTIIFEVHYIKTENRHERITTFCLEEIFYTFRACLYDPAYPGLNEALNDFEVSQVIVFDLGKMFNFCLLKISCR